MGSSPVGDLPVDTDRWPALLAESLKRWMTIDDDAVRQIWQACRRGLADCTEEEVAWFCRSKEPLIRSGRIHALAHITGGGLLENIPRVLPKGLHARVDAGAWEQSRLMAFLQAQGNIEPAEMARTFNCGLGMVLAVHVDEVPQLMADLLAAGETPHVIGAIEEGPRGCSVQGAAEVWSAREDWEAVHLA